MRLPRFLTNPIWAVVHNDFPGKSAREQSCVAMSRKHRSFIEAPIRRAYVRVNGIGRKSIELQQCNHRHSHTAPGIIGNMRRTTHAASLPKRKPRVVTRPAKAHQHSIDLSLVQVTGARNNK